jgi:hypothetical protein
VSLCLVCDSGLRVGNVSARNVINLANAGSVNESEEGSVAVFDNVSKARVVARLKRLFDVTRNGYLRS